MEKDDAAASAFIEAVQRGDAEQIADALKQHPELKDHLDAPWFSFGAPALVQLAPGRNREGMDALLDAGADPDARSDWTAGPYSALEILVDSADIDDALAEHLLARGATLDLHAAAGLGRLEVVRELLEAAPGRVNEPGPDGATPLHLARSVEVAEYLLARGADL